MTDDKIFIAERGNTFKEFIVSILTEKTTLNKKYINILTNEVNMSFFEMCFTHSSFDPSNNYEFFEILGDGTVNKAVIWYLQRKYPILKCSEGVRYLARLKIMLVSRKTLASFAENLGFFNFISSSESLRKLKKNELLEDTFEAFIGCMEYILDKDVKIHTGYSIAYNFLSKLIESIEIPAFNYEDLWDAKSRLKELFDYMNNQSLRYTSIKEKHSNGFLFITTVRADFENEGEKVNIILGDGSAPTKLEAEQEAAKMSLNFLKSQGINKEVKNNLPSNVID